MAGDLSGFSRARAESALRFAMQIATPTDPSRAPIFLLPPEVPEEDVDSLGVAWDPNDDSFMAPTEVADIPCACEFVTSQSDDVAGGQGAQVGTLVVTMLEDEFSQVSSCRGLRHSGVEYVRVSNPPDLAIGPMGVRQMRFRAVDL